MYSNYSPLIEVTRGPIVESVHFGAVAVVDVMGNLLASYGDPDTATYLRSSAKPFQALPFVEKGGAEKFGLTDRELALMCASHSGTDEHVRVVTGMQKKIGVSESDLMCGSHPPYHQGTVEALIQRGEKTSPNRHNCSGKHTGMLAHALMRQLSTEDYINPGHPIQQSILSAFAEMCDLTPDQVVLGIDGCSAPNFAAPLRNAALGYARLCDPGRLSEERAAACRRIARSMAANGDMVGGPGRYDSILMQAAEGVLVSKGGAEGYQGIGLLPGAMGPGSPAVGIAFKIMDGDGYGRACPLVATEILRELGVLTPKMQQALGEFDNRTLYNFRKLEIGDIHNYFALKFN
jgi:L-asparaginase II